MSAPVQVPQHQPGCAIPAQFTECVDQGPVYTSLISQGWQVCFVQPAYDPRDKGIAKLFRYACGCGR